MLAPVLNLTLNDSIEKKPTHTILYFFLYFTLDPRILNWLNLG